MILLKQNFFKTLVLLFSFTLITTFIIPQKNANAKEFDNSNPVAVFNKNKNSFKVNPHAIKGLSSQEAVKVKQNVDIMNAIIQTNKATEVTSDSVTVEISDTELINTAREAGYDVPIPLVRGKEGITKVRWNSWGVEVWLSKTAVKTLGAVGYAGFSFMLGTLIPAGIGALVAAMIAPFYTNYILNKANALYMKVWYSGKRTISYQ